MFRKRRKKRKEIRRASAAAMKNKTEKYFKMKHTMPWLCVFPSQAVHSIVYRMRILSLSHAGKLFRSQLNVGLI